MFYSILRLSSPVSRIQIAEATALLYNEISKLKHYNRMKDLKDLVDLLMSKDEALKAEYKEQVTRAVEELHFHEKKIKHLTAFIEQREEFIKQIEGKLRQVDRREEKLIKAIQSNG